ncbi:MAG: DUF2232 domain-containing protein [Clostridiaceae bacterium]
MENNNQTLAPASNSAWRIVLVAVLAGAAALFIPFGLIVVPALWAYAGARTKPGWIALPALVYAAGALLLYSPLSDTGLMTASAVAVMTAASAIALYYLQTKRFSNTYTALTLAGVFLVGLYAGICMPGVISGSGAFAKIQTAMDEIINLYRAAFVQAAGADVEYATAVNEYLNAFSKAVPTFVVPALCIFAGTMGLSNLLFFRLFCRKHKEIKIPPIREFRYWSLPRSMMIGLFALLIGALILEWSGWEYAESLVNTVNVLVGMPLLLQGLAVVDFLIVRSSRKTTSQRVVTYVLIGVLFGLAEMPLMLLGGFEQLFHFRARTQGLPPQSL